MKNIYYTSPAPSACADVIPFWADGQFQLFYLRDLRDPALGEGCPWCLLTTPDLTNYHDYGPVLKRGAADEQDLYVFTGSVIKLGDRYCIYYTGHNHHMPEQGKPMEKIMRAFSTDLVHWEKDPSFLFAPPEYLEQNDFRDPFVYYDEVNKEYRMLIASREKSDLPANMRGVTMLAQSPDGLCWTLRREPFFAPHAYYTHECPDLFKMGEWWYLLFSEFTDKVSTTYRMSKSPDGPWLSPKVNTFDGHAYYAAKSTADAAGRRILFGWNPTKSDCKDSNGWQWGGYVIPHEIVQNPDGTLSVRCPMEVKNAHVTPVALTEGRTVGAVSRTAEGYRLGDLSATGQSVQMVGAAPAVCTLRAKLRYTGQGGDFGILVHVSDDGNRFYKIKFDPVHARLAMDGSNRRTNVLHFMPDTERYLPVQSGDELDVLVIMQDTVIEVYVNDTVAMSSRTYDIPAGQVGFYCQDCILEVKDISVKE